MRIGGRDLDRRKSSSGISSIIKANTMDRGVSIGFRIRRDSAAEGITTSRVILVRTNEILCDYNS